MKLAEALSNRATLKTRLRELMVRVRQNAKTQQGEEAAEDANVLLEQYNENEAQLLDLVQRINRTNAATVFEGNDTLADAIAQRDEIRRTWNAYSALLRELSELPSRTKKEDIRFVRTASPKEVQKLVDAYAAAFRKLDLRIQELNWMTELL